MIEFTLLVKYHGGARAFLGMPDPRETAEALCRSCGVELKEIKLTFGPVHLLVFGESSGTQLIFELVRNWEKREDVAIQILIVHSRDEYLRLLSVFHASSPVMTESTDDDAEA